MAKTYTLQEMGQKLKQSNPGRFDNYSDAQLAQFYVEAKPKAKEKVLQESKAGGFLKGLGKSITSTVKETAKLGESVFDAGLRTILPKSLETKFGVAKGQPKSTDILQAQAEKSLDITPGSLTEARTGSQKVGKFTGDVGQFFIPGGAVTKLGKASEAAVLGSKVLSGTEKVSKATKFGSKVARYAPQVAGDVGVTLAQTGDPTSAGVSGAISSAVPIIGKGLKTVFKGTGRVASQVFGKATGAGDAAIQEAFINPNVMKFARKAGKEGVEELQDKALGQARQGFNTLKEARRNKYIGQLEKIKLDKTQLDDITNSVRESAKDVLSKDRYNIRVAPTLDSTGKVLNKLDFSGSTITNSQNIVEKAMNDILGWTDNTAAGLDTLKKRLGDYVDQIPETRGPARSLVTSLRESVDTALKKNVTGYEEMTKGYREASQMIEEIQKSLSLGDRASKDTAIKKLMSTMRQNNETRKELLKILSGAAGEDIMGSIAGSTLSSYTPRGLAGVLTPTTATIGSFIAPAFAPQMLLTLAATSPRLVGELVSILGRVNARMIKSNKFSPAIERAIRALLLRAAEGDTKKSNLGKK